MTSSGGTGVAQLVVRNIEQGVKERLRRRAKLHGQSMEEEVRDILRDAVRDESPAKGLGSEIAQLFKGIGLDNEIEELRGHELEPARFRH